MNPDACERVINGYREVNVSAVVKEGSEEVCGNE